MLKLTSGKSANDTQLSRTTRRGFTLVELLIVSTMITVTTSLLLPAIQKVREAANEQAAENYCTYLALEAHDFYEQYQSLPGEQWWADQARMVGSEVLDDGAIEFAGYRFKYVWTFPTCVVSAQPAEPGLTGSRGFRIRVQAGTQPSADDVRATAVRGADERRREALTRIRTDAQRSIANLHNDTKLVSDPSADSLPNGNLTEIAFDDIDTNRDGEISVEEVAGRRSVLPQGFTKSIRRNLKLGAGNEHASASVSRSTIMAE